jgi:glycerol-3-phosphate dehydrogenase
MTTESLNRREDRIRQTEIPFDLIVIGGGCNGAATAWDAALRGLRVLLLEKEDFGWATSAWNSRLIHGGLKYLEKYDVRLVRESLREREWMLHAAPHLVRPRRFVLPFFKRNAHPSVVLRLGMIAYDALSWDKSTPWHKTHGSAGALRLVPGLNTDGLQGAATYFDGQVDYAERLSLEAALAAEAAGAVVLNHAQVERVIVENDAVGGVEFLDTVGGERHTARAAAVVNAAGPWVDGVLATTEVRARRPLMGGTKGTHLVVDPFPGAPQDSAMYYEALTDARPMMVIPWLGRYIIGATDVRFTGDLDTASSDDEEIDYILRETNLVLPGANLAREDILWSYTGVRPLPYQESGPTSDITRRHIVHHHADDERPVRGLFSVIGGKLTTFRAVAEHVNDEVLGKARRGRRGRGKRTATTRTARLPGAQALDFDEFARRFVRESDLPEDVALRLVRLYGTRATAVQALAQADPGLGKRIDGTPGAIAAEIAYALRVESAVTLADIVARRIMTGLDGTMGRESLEAVGEVAASLAGWSEARLAQEVDAYLHYLVKFHPRGLGGE